MDSTKRLLRKAIWTSPMIAKIAAKAHYDSGSLTEFDRRYVQNWLKKHINQSGNSQQTSD